MGYWVQFEGPLMVTKIQGELTDAEQQEYFERIERDVFARRRRHLSLIITDQPSVWTPPQRTKHQDFHRQHQIEIRDLCAASALAMPEVSMVVRFAMSAVMMMSPGSPTQIFRSEREARRWLDKYRYKC